MPIERAVPSTCFIAPSMLMAFRSFILSSAISRTCLRLTLPTLSLFGTPEPFSTPAALRKSTAAGDVFSTKVKEPSVKTVISAGITSPGRLDVRALYSLQKAMMLIPWPASAGPTGGAGLAFPASSWRRTIALNFFAIFYSLWFWRAPFRGVLPRYQAKACYCLLFAPIAVPGDGLGLSFLHLQEIQLHRCLASKERDHNTNLGTLHIDLGYHAAEVVERSIDDADALANLVGDLDGRRFGFHALDDLGDFFRAKRRRIV